MLRILIDPKHASVAWHNALNDFEVALPGMEPWLAGTEAAVEAEFQAALEQWRFERKTYEGAQAAADALYTDELRAWEGRWYCKGPRPVRGRYVLNTRLQPARRSYLAVYGRAYLAGIRATLTDRRDVARVAAAAFEVDEDYAIGMARWEDGTALQRVLKNVRGEA